MENKYYFIFVVSLIIGTFCINNNAKASLTYLENKAVLASLDSKLTEPNQANSLKTVKLYNSLVGAFKNSLYTIAQRLQKYLLNLLVAFGFASIVYIVAKSFITGEPLMQTLIYKLITFIILGLLLKVDIFNDYILKYIIELFNNIPSLFSNAVGNNIIDNIIKQNSELTLCIQRKVDEIGWGWNILAYIAAFVAMCGILLMMVIILLNVLEISFYFYTTLCLSSIFILLFFFKSTRNYSMGAINFIVTSLLNIIVLSFFLSIIGEMFKTLLVYENSLDFITNCFAIVILTTISTFLLTRVKSIGQAITAQGMATVSPTISTIYRKFNQK